MSSWTCNKRQCLRHCFYHSLWPRLLWHILIHSLGHTAKYCHNLNSTNTYVNIKWPRGPSLNRYQYILHQWIKSYGPRNLAMTSCSMQKFASQRTKFNSTKSIKLAISIVFCNFLYFNCFPNEFFHRIIFLQETFSPVDKNVFGLRMNSVVLGSSMTSKISIKIQNGVWCVNFFTQQSVFT